ncbi:MAG: thioredoxin fold domain-containing protein [Candidatus Thiodiazotropha lotti]|uniref:Thioredoxin fold domain-containing protein n=1 Tax=Candidatus Thiodiazotropha lotti TaxID=2792787 RepID=A0A9E4K659_9GAMM|nr:thioredoxin fold domain-containing protein [Candidatus Thiodiazotropha lotti]MCG7939525.1 thioredoxin fold domain-containing protein [Candidatus Thiodiazotropha lotti]MCW4203998.1 thioredoxin fold domain-containing protein [Candidatus Thiodiazotropha lotti]
MSWLFCLLILVSLLLPLQSFAGNQSELFSEPGYRIANYRRPLPDQPPAGERIDTEILLELIKRSNPLLVDVLAITLRPESAEFGLSWLPASPRQNLPGSTWLPNVGYGYLEPCMLAWLERTLQRLTGGDLNRAVVFYCITDCWMSWNVVKRASELGYRNLYWYPEGSDGWAAAGLPLVAAEPQPLPGMTAGEKDTLFDCPATDLKAALNRSDEADKQGVLLFFETHHCPFCRRMRAGVLADPGLITHYRRNFVALALDMESDQPLTDFDGTSTSAREVAQRLGVVRTPTMLFLDNQGEEAYRYSGLIVDPRRFRSLADYVSGGHQQSIGFKTYYKQQQD